MTDASLFGIDPGRAPLECTIKHEKHASIRILRSGIAHFRTLRLLALEARGGSRGTAGEALAGRTRVPSACAPGFQAYGRHAGWYHRWRSLGLRAEIEIQFVAALLDLDLQRGDRVAMGRQHFRDFVDELLT